MDGYRKDQWTTIFDPENKIKKAFKNSKNKKDPLLQGVCLI